MFEILFDFKADTIEIKVLNDLSDDEYQQILLSISALPNKPHKLWFELAANFQGLRVELLRNNAISMLLNAHPFIAIAIVTDDQLLASLAQAAAKEIAVPTKIVNVQDRKQAEDWLDRGYKC